MAFELLARGAEPVNHSSSPGSSFALPGQNLPPSWTATSYILQWAVDMTYGVWIGIRSGHCWDPVRPDPGYTSIMVARTSTWKFTWNAAGYLNIPQPHAVLAQATVNASSGFYDWHFTNYPQPPMKGSNSLSDYGMHWIADLRNLGWSESNPRNAYIYICGTGTYRVTAPIYPTPFKLVLKGIRAPILDYFPFATKSASAWNSCNRSGGYVQARKASAWQNKKNEDNKEAKSTVFYRHNGAWKISPKIGSGG